MYEAKHNLNPRDFANTFKEINDKYPTRYSKNNFEKPKATRRGSRTAVPDPLLATIKTTSSAIFSQGLHF